MYSISGITLFESFRMNENFSNLCWYPLYDPTCTDSDLLQLTERLNLSGSTNISQSIQRIQNVPSNVPSSEIASNVTRQRKTGAAALGTNNIEFTSSDQAYKWHRKLSDGGPAAGGIVKIFLYLVLHIYTNVRFFL